MMLLANGSTDRFNMMKTAIYNFQVTQPGKGTERNFQKKKVPKDSKELEETDSFRKRVLEVMLN